MAEVVGVVAAGFAFGEVALKMSAHVFKLKHMWEDMKEIPDHVRMLVHEIELLSRVLHEMEADLNSPSQDGASWGGIGVLIVSICRSAVDVLDASVNALSQELASVRGVRRTMHKVKLVLKQDFKVFLPRLRPGHYQLPIRDRLGWILFLSSVPAHSLRYILWKDGKARMEDVRALDEIQYPLIKLVATRYNNPCAQILDVSADGARDLARQIIRCTTLLHSLLGFISIKGTLDCSQESFTALYCVARPGRSCYCLRCRTMTWTWKRRRTERGLRQWLEDVQAAGTDLREYGKIEAKIFQETKSIRSLKYDFSYWDCGTSEPSEASSYCTLVAFTYGPEPKDWKFTWDLQCYEFAGEFWELIENPPLYMVGGWDNDW